MKKKLSTKELEDLKLYKSQNESLCMRLGQVEVGFIQLKEEKSQILEQLNSIRESANNLAKELEEKYGSGSIDLELGEFTPTV